MMTFVLLLAPLLTDAAQARGPQVVLFSDRGPVLLRLQIRLDGVPIQRSWEDYVRAWVRYADRDGDGWLDEQELAAIPNASGMQSMLRSGYAFPQQQGTLKLTNLGKAAGAKCGAADVLAYYASQNTFAVTVNALNGFRGGFPAPNDEQLFKLLDRNNDGKLSREELQQAYSALRKLDFDDDETIALAEIAGTPNFQGGRVVMGGGMMRPGQAGVAGIGFYALPAQPAPGQLALLLFTQYDKKHRGKLSQDELGLEKSAFHRLDRNQDGLLDAEELASWLNVVSPIVIDVHLGKAPTDVPPVRVLPNRRSTSVQLEPNGVAVVKCADAQLSISRQEGAAGYMVNNRQVLVQQFQFANPKQKPFLTLDDFKDQRFRFLANLFPMLDRNGDGQLTKEEIESYADMQAQAQRVTASLNINEMGRSLFTLLDANRDGRLSQRELKSAWERLAPLDRDGDGFLSSGEMMQQFVFTLARDTQFAGFNPMQAGGAVQPGGDRGSALRGAPAWFLKMDVNGDGDVSWREFLGAREVFERLDRNGDGVIGPEEARAAGEIAAPARSK